MIEQLARAMCLGLNLAPDELVAKPKNDFDLVDHFFTLNPPQLLVDNRVKKWTLFVDAVRGVLETLKNPTHQMLEEGEIRFTGGGVGGRKLKDSWIRMLAAAAGGYDPPPSETLKATPIPVLQDWVGTISRRQQGVLVLALRGPDGLPKEHGVKNAVRSMRACVMNSGREGKPMELGQRYRTDPFMRMDLFGRPMDWQNECTTPFFAALDQYNIHFYIHFLHAAAVLGFNHPLEVVRERWLAFYKRGCDAIHMNPESQEEFTHRLRDGIRENE